MTEPTVEQIRYFRLRSHHLDKFYDKNRIPELVGACGMQNSPPGAWETALYNRILGGSLSEMEQLLYEKKSLLQAWSLRGTPVVFPASESDAFLSSLIAKDDEPWIYTQGIALALDFLQMGFDELFEMLKLVIPGLDGQLIVSKTALDQTLAQWMLPLLPADKRDLWNQPSMYGSPDKQTVGGRGAANSRDTGKAQDTKNTEDAAGKNWCENSCTVTDRRRQTPLSPGWAVPLSRGGACGHRFPRKWNR